MGKFFPLLLPLCLLPAASAFCLAPISSLYLYILSGSPHFSFLEALPIVKLKFSIFTFFLCSVLLKDRRVKIDFFFRGVCHH